MGQPVKTQIVILKINPCGTDAQKDKWLTEIRLHSWLKFREHLDYGDDELPAPPSAVLIL